MAACEAKPIVDEIKAKVKGKKFYPGSHAEPRTVHFSTPRFPRDRAEQLLGFGADGKPAVREFKGEQSESKVRTCDWRKIKPPPCTPREEAAKATFRQPGHVMDYVNFV